MQRMQFLQWMVQRWMGESYELQWRVMVAQRIAIQRVILVVNLVEVEIIIVGTVQVVEITNQEIEGIGVLIIAVGIDILEIPTGTTTGRTIGIHTEKEGIHHLEDHLATEAVHTQDHARNQGVLLLHHHVIIGVCRQNHLIDPLY